MRQSSLRRRYQEVAGHSLAKIADASEELHQVLVQAEREDVLDPAEVQGRLQLAGAPLGFAGLRVANGVRCA